MKRLLLILFLPLLSLLSNSAHAAVFVGNAEDYKIERGSESKCGYDFRFKILFKNRIIYQTSPGYCNSLREVEELENRLYQAEINKSKIRFDSEKRGKLTEAFIIVEEVDEATAVKLNKRIDDLSRRVSRLEQKQNINTQSNETAFTGNAQ